MQSLSYVKTDSWISLANLPDQWAEEEKSKQKEKIPVFVFGRDGDGLYLKCDKNFVERRIVITKRFLHIYYFEMPHLVLYNMGGGTH